MSAEAADEVETWLLNLKETILNLFQSRTSLSIR